MHAACRQPYALTFIQFFYLFIERPWYTQIQSPDLHPRPTKCNPLLFSPFIIKPPQIFFPSPKSISEIAHSQHQPQKVVGGRGRGVFCCGKIPFVLPQLPPPPSTSLLPPSTLFLSFLPNFSLHLLSRQIQIRGDMLQLHTWTTLQVS